MSTPERIVIANCGGFWGDDPTAARRQVDGGHVDYLVMDYLAEITMAILQRQRSKDPRAGYAKDFLVQLEDVLVDCVAKGITVISNAGGVNPDACAAAVEELAVKLGVADKVVVAVVSGDDLYGDLDALLDAGHTLEHLDSGAPLREVKDRALSANAYLGAPAIVAALSAGANIVIAGRVTDTSVTLAPMMHAFGWGADDFNKLASGIVAGHIIECGTQCCGGNFTDWESVPDFRNMGYPLIEAYADGSFVVTKHPGTGGMVTTRTVSEQLLYEMGSPRYLSPDCVARFDSIRLEQEGRDRVRVSGVLGEPPPEKLKVAISLAGGYRSTGRMLVSGPGTLRKAAKAADIFWDLAGGRDHYERASTQFIGWDASHPPLGVEEPSEVLMQLSVFDGDRAKIDRDFGPMVVGCMLQSMPGMIMPADQGRPRASEVVTHWPALIDRGVIAASVRIGATVMPVESVLHRGAAPADVGAGEEATNVAPDDDGTDRVTVPLAQLCLARSGDKGDAANVGVLARSFDVYSWMVRELTPDVIEQHFKGVVLGGVERYCLPNLGALNFLLRNSLGGGGTASLQFDNQGKTYAQFLLTMQVTVPLKLVDGVA